MKLGTREEWSKRPEELIGSDNCPFCEEKKDEEYNLWKGKYWYIKQNKYPYTKNEFHLMIVPIAHYEFFQDVPAENWTEMKVIHEFLNDYFHGKEYFSFTRETLGNRSIKHLHMHIIHGGLGPGIIMSELEKQGINN